MPRLAPVITATRPFPDDGVAMDRAMVVVASSDMRATKTTAFAIFLILTILLSSIIVVKVLGSGKRYLRMGMDTIPCQCEKKDSDVKKSCPRLTTP